MKNTISIKLQDEDGKRTAKLEEVCQQLALEGLDELSTVVGDDLASVLRLAKSSGYEVLIFKSDEDGVCGCATCAIKVAIMEAIANCDVGRINTLESAGKHVAAWELYFASLVRPGTTEALEQTYCEVLNAGGRLEPHALERIQAFRRFVYAIRKSAHDEGKLPNPTDVDIAAFIDMEQAGREQLEAELREEKAQGLEVRRQFGRLAAAVGFAVAGADVPPEAAKRLQGALREAAGLIRCPQCGGVVSGMDTIPEGGKGPSVCARCAADALADVMEAGLGMVDMNANHRRLLKEQLDQMRDLSPLTVGARMIRATLNTEAAQRKAVEAANPERPLGELREEVQSN